ncbi:MAG TPA: flagellar hook-length control protein FliK, partial [Phenylobacterium sp.]|nr:flagellar hook-length control protein FliK [Phenylobacterium sp.]
KPVSAKGSRIDITKTAAAPGAPATAAAATATPALGSSAKAADALTAGADQAPKAAIEDPSQGPALEAKAGAAGPAPSPADPNATAATTTPATLIHAAAAAVRGAPQTVANLAAQIVKKLDGRTSQFDVQLDPAGLGKVDVRIAIGADGRMSAAMRFDTPQAAAELKSRSAELQQAMEQAGFDLSGGMSFDVAGGRGQGGQAHDQQAEPGAAFRGRAFQTALDATADANPPPQLTLRRTALAGVDIRI